MSDGMDLAKQVIALKTELEKKKGSVRKRLNRLLRDGDIVRISKGVYCHVDYVPSGEGEE